MGLILHSLTPRVHLAVFAVWLGSVSLRPLTHPELYPRKLTPEAVPKYISGRTSYLRVRLAYHPYPQLISELCHVQEFGPPEAVIEIIRARTEEGLRCALWQLEGKLSYEINMLHSEIVGAIALLEAYIDFPEEELSAAREDLSGRVGSVSGRINPLLEGYYRWRPFREGIVTTIVGRTNVGKSSLLNVLTGEERAIVTPHPGTTRDIVDGIINIDGIPLRLLDTAGLRMAKDLAEEEGIRRMYHTVEMAELILLILDGSEAVTGEDREIMGRTTGRKRVIVINKIDKGNRITKDLDLKDAPVVCMSVLKGEGIESLKNTLRQSIIAQEMKWEGEAA